MIGQPEMTFDGLLVDWGSEPAPHDKRTAEDAQGMQRVLDDLRKSMPSIRELASTARDEGTREAVSAVYAQLRQRLEDARRRWAGDDLVPQIQALEGTVIGRHVRPRELEVPEFRERVREIRAVLYGMDPIQVEVELDRADLETFIAIQDAPAVRPLIHDAGRIARAREQLARRLDPEGFAELDRLISARTRMASNWATFARAVHDITGGEVDLVPGASEFTARAATAGAS